MESKKKMLLQNLGQDRNKDADLPENELEDMEGGRVSWDKVREWHGHIYTTNVKSIASGKQPHSTGRSALCFVTT